MHCPIQEVGVFQHVWSVLWQRVGNFQHRTQARSLWCQSIPRLWFLRNGHKHFEEKPRTPPMWWLFTTIMLTANIFSFVLFAHSKMRSHWEFPKRNLSLNSRFLGVQLLEIYSLSGATKTVCQFKEYSQVLADNGWVVWQCFGARGLRSWNVLRMKEKEAEEKAKGQGKSFEGITF